MGRGYFLPPLTLTGLNSMADKCVLFSLDFNTATPNDCRPTHTHERGLYNLDLFIYFYVFYFLPLLAHAHRRDPPPHPHPGYVNSRDAGYLLFEPKLTEEIIFCGRFCLRILFLLLLLLHFFLPSSFFRAVNPPSQLIQWADPP